MKHVIVVGAGNLAATLVKGWLSPAPGDMKLSILTRSNAYQARGWVADERALPSFDPEILTTADIIVLAVKPKDVPVALTAIGTYARPEALLLSCAAGVTLHALTEALPRRAVVRAMPNIAVAVHDGTVVVAEGSGLEHALWPTLKSFLASLGHVVVVPEAWVDPATAVSGSGPAYAYVLLQALLEAGSQMGLPRHLARDLAAHAVRGAAEVALAFSEQTFSELTGWVASPGGTTEAALAVLKRAEVEDTLRRAILAAGSQAERLGHTEAEA